MSARRKAQTFVLYTELLGRNRRQYYGGTAAVRLSLPSTGRKTHNLDDPICYIGNERSCEDFIRTAYHQRKTVSEVLR